MKRILSSLFLICLLNSVNAKSLFYTLVQDTTAVSNNEVDYKVSQDQNNIYLRVSTADAKTIMSVRNKGISVYFDIKGKKKKNVSIKYPLLPIRLNSKPDKDVKEDIQRLEEDNAVKQNLVKLFENPHPLEAEYVYFDQQEKFNVLLNSLDIDVSLAYDKSTGLLEYNLKIPKNKINTSSKKDLRKLTIGIKTNRKDLKENHRERPQSSMSRGTVGSSGPRGGGQGSGPPGGRGGQKGGSQPPSKKQKPSDVELDFWFEANLQTSSP